MLASPENAAPWPSFRKLEARQRIVSGKQQLEEADFCATKFASHRFCHLAQHELLDLARAGLGNLGEDDKARTLVGGKAVAAMRDDLLRGGRHTGLQFDERHRRFSPFLVRLADDGTGGD